MLRKLKQRLKSAFLASVENSLERSILLQGRMASMQVRSKEVISALQEVEFKVSSQWGEDGIIDWLVERAGIPPAAHTFIEFGVENYREANTRFLMQNRNWRGFIMDGDTKLRSALEADNLLWKFEILARSVFITRENINGLIAESGLTGEIGLLSIDLDGNDYWIWEAIDVVRPILCICEYNPVFGDMHTISVPYNASFQRANQHFSNLYFGASLGALRSLAKRKGYRFVGTTTAANDAFFVREDYAEGFVDTSIRTVVALPSRVRESRDESGKLDYVTGLDRLRAIVDMKVVHTDTGETVRIGDLEEVYSPEWLAMMGQPPAEH